MLINTFPEALKKDDPLQQPVLVFKYLFHNDSCSTKHERDTVMLGSNVIYMHVRFLIYNVIDRNIYLFRIETLCWNIYVFVHVQTFSWCAVCALWTVHM